MNSNIVFTNDTSTNYFKILVSCRKISLSTIHEELCGDYFRIIAGVEGFYDKVCCALVRQRQPMCRELKKLLGHRSEALNYTDREILTRLEVQITSPSKAP